MDFATREGLLTAVLLLLLPLVLLWILVKLLPPYVETDEPSSSEPVRTLGTTSAAWAHGC
jgi:hypothetical protein